VRDKIMKRLSDVAKENEVITIVHDIQWFPRSLKG
jgi:hypothetical protein